LYDRDVRYGIDRYIGNIVILSLNVYLSHLRDGFAGRNMDAGQNFTVENKRRRKNNEGKSS
jgi:hypothetical protein